MMKVRNAMICLDCDSIYEQWRGSCPACLSYSAIELRRYFPAMDEGAAGEVKKLTTTTMPIQEVPAIESANPKQNRKRKNAVAGRHPAIHAVPRVSRSEQRM